MIDDFTADDQDDVSAPVIFGISITSPGPRLTSAGSTTGITRGICFLPIRMPIFA